MKKSSSGQPWVDSGYLAVFQGHPYPNRRHLWFKHPPVQAGEICKVMLWSLPVDALQCVFSYLGRERDAAASHLKGCVQGIALPSGCHSEFHTTTQDKAEKTDVSDSTWDEGCLQCLWCP